MARVQLPLRYTLLVSIDGGLLLILRAKQGRNQQGLCFVPSEVFDSIIKVCELQTESKSLLVDIRCSDKVPEGAIILDSRIYQILACDDEEEISVIGKNEEIPTCIELHLGVVSKRSVRNDQLAQAISKRIDDFKDYFEGLIFRQGQRINIDDLGISFELRSLSPISSVSGSARIHWKKLLKIHLDVIESKASNFYFIVEVAAATQIADVKAFGDDGGSYHITRHQAILESLDSIEKHFDVQSSNAWFSGILFSDEVCPYITYDSQTGEETEITPLYSPSLMKAFRNWLGQSVNEHKNKPSNIGAALRYASDMVQLLNEKNGLPSIIILFSSGIFSTGKNPVKVAQMVLSGLPVKILCISVGEDSTTDIMEAIAKHTDGTMIHLNRTDRTSLIVDTLNIMTGQGDVDG